MLPPKGENWTLPPKGGQENFRYDNSCDPLSQSNAPRQPWPRLIKEVHALIPGTSEHIMSHGKGK